MKEMENNNYTVAITQGFNNKGTAGGQSAGVSLKYTTCFEAQGMYNLGKGTYYVTGKAKK